VPHIASRTISKVHHSPTISSDLASEQFIDSKELRFMVRLQGMKLRHAI
jgi:hypothetical protein